MGTSHLYQSTGNRLMLELRHESYTAFSNGEWVTIQETITKEQAEKELGKTIID